MGFKTVNLIGDLPPAFFRNNIDLSHLLEAEEPVGGMETIVVNYYTGNVPGEVSFSDGSESNEGAGAALDRDTVRGEEGAGDGGTHITTLHEGAMGDDHVHPTPEGGVAVRVEELSDDSLPPEGAGAALDRDTLRGEEGAGDGGTHITTLHEGAGEGAGDASSALPMGERERLLGNLSTLYDMFRHDSFRLPYVWSAVSRAYENLHESELIENYPIYMDNVQRIINFWTFTQERGGLELSSLRADVIYHHMQNPTARVTVDYMERVRGEGDRISVVIGDVESGDIVRLSAFYNMVEARVPTLPLDIVIAANEEGEAGDGRCVAACIGFWYLGFIALGAVGFFMAFDENY